MGHSWHSVCVSLMWSPAHRQKPELCSSPVHSLDAGPWSLGERGARAGCILSPLQARPTRAQHKPVFGGRSVNIWTVWMHTWACCVLCQQGRVWYSMHSGDLLQANAVSDVFVLLKQVKFNCLPNTSSLHLSPPPAHLPLPLGFSIQSVQMVQSPRWVSPLVACRITAFPLLTLLMHQSVVFVLQSKRVTPPSLFNKKGSGEGTSRTKTKLGSGPRQRRSPPTHNKSYLADGMQWANKNIILHE